MLPLNLPKSRQFLKNRLKIYEIAGSMTCLSFRQMLVELVYIRRRELNRFRHTGEYSEELIRERERELDLEEARLKT